MIKDCPFLNRNIKLLPCQRERVKALWETGNYSQSNLANMFNVSRPLITLILDDKQMERTITNRRAKGNKYYDTKENTDNTRNFRAYQKLLGIKRKY